MRALVKKYQNVANLLRGQYLFEILHTAITVKNSENVVESRCFENPFLQRESIFIGSGKDI